MAGRRSGLQGNVTPDIAAATTALAQLQQQLKEVTDALVSTGAASGNAIAANAAAITQTSQAQNAAALQQLGALAQAQQANFAKISDTGTRDMAQSAKAMASLLQPVEQAADSYALSVVRGTNNAQGALLRLGQSLLASEIAGNTKRLGQWVATEAAKTASTTTGNAARAASDQAAGAASQSGFIARALQTISTDAAQAFGGVFAFLSPSLGPAAAAPAAAAQGSVLAAAGAVTSAAGGWDRVPVDGMLAQLHKNEMVLPASIASPLRGAVGDWQSGGQASSAATHHFHYAPTLHLNAARMSRGDVETMLRDHSGVFSRHIQNALRNGMTR